MKVFKFPIYVEDRQLIEMPAGARILCVQTQRGTPCLWAYCNESAPKEKRVIVTHGTGHEASDVAAEDYVGTYQLAEGELIFHVFAPFQEVPQ